MADRDVWRKNIPEDFDGRFGDKFDSEVVMGPVVQVTIGVVVSCVVGFVVVWGMLALNDRSVEAAMPTALPIDQANENRLPTGPLLQADPEAELEELRHEMATRLNGFGWVDQAAGVVHIPIDQAIGLMAVEPEPASAEPAATEADPTEGEATDAPADDAAAGYGEDSADGATDDDHDAGAGA